jgi:predicted ribosome-associated RNA-binding protein Tma20
MTYNKLNNLLKNHSELHYISDSDIFFEDNNINIDKYKNNKFILFEYTTEFIPTINILNNNNIKYTIHTDSLDLKYIII